MLKIQVDQWFQERCWDGFELYILKLPNAENNSSEVDIKDNMLDQDRRKGPGLRSVK